jgi:hypothetical protein
MPVPVVNYAAPLHSCKYRWLQAPATNFVWTKRSPVCGDLLLSLAGMSLRLLKFSGGSVDSYAL